MKIGIIVGSIRDGRKGEPVGRWVHAATHDRDDATFELIDLKEFNVPLLTTNTHPAAAKREYDSPEVQAWSEAIDACDGFIFVTSEYNHGVPGAFKNAVDSIAPEWTGKTVAFVSYGSVEGIRAVEQWRQIIANFNMHDIRSQVSLSIFTDFTDDGEVTGETRNDDDLGALLDAIVAATAARLAGEAASA